MTQYVFRDIPLCIMNANKADAQKIGEAVAKARDTAGLGDPREKLVEAASNRRHPCYKHFEWDDTIAGHKYRLEQANDLIRIIAVENADGEKEPAFIKLVPSRGGGAFYTPDEIRDSANLQEAALAAADRDLEAFQKRHRVLSDICQIIGEARAKIRQKREGTEHRATAA